MVTNSKEYQKRYYDTHKEYFRNYYQNHIEQFREHAKKYYQKHPRECIESRKKLRLKIFEKLGNKCSNPNCLVPGGCSDIRCLQIDHVHGNGTEEAKQLRNWYKFLKKVLADTEGNYQLLCANCNWIKRDENGEFHKKLFKAVM